MARKILFPIVGPLLTIPAAFAANWAMGRVAIEYFRTPGQSKDKLRQVYAEAKHLTGDVGGKASTTEFTDAVIQKLG